VHADFSNKITNSFANNHYWLIFEPYGFWHSNFSIILQKIIIPEKIQNVYPNFHPMLKLMASRELSIQISGIMVGTLFRKENAVRIG